MAWIKVEVSTPDKPEINHMARLCKAEHGAVFEGWFRLWAWLDGQTADGHERLCTPEACDRISGVPGMGRALAEVGWMEFHDGGALVIGWERHNGQSAKERALTANRVATFRAKTGKDNGYRHWKA
jgi:hypothetical protein